MKELKNDGTPQAKLDIYKHLGYGMLTLLYRDVKRRFRSFNAGKTAIGASVFLGWISAAEGQALLGKLTLANLPKDDPIPPSRKDKGIRPVRIKLPLGHRASHARN